MLTMIDVERILMTDIEIEGGMAHAPPADQAAGLPVGLAAPQLRVSVVSNRRVMVVDDCGVKLVICLQGVIL